MDKQMLHIKAEYWHYRAYELACREMRNWIAHEKFKRKADRLQRRFGFTDWAPWTTQ